MTPKQIQFSDHAILRLRERAIRRADVRWLLARGERTAELSLGAQGRWGRRGYLGKHEAKVIYLEDATTILVVTVEWID